MEDPRRELPADPDFVLPEDRVAIEAANLAYATRKNV